MLFLIAFATYTKLSEKYRFSYEPNDRFQTYLLTAKEAPKQLFFAGEEIPLHDQQVARKLQKEMQVNAYYNNSQAQMLQRAAYWLPQFDAILKQYKIPRDFRYLAVVESMLTNVESPRGAAGYWQMMVSAGQTYGLEINEEVDERYHPIKATHAACKYLRQSHRTFGNWTNVAASYNAGIGGVLQAMRRQNHSSFYKLRLNTQTSRYLFKITAYKQLIEHPKEFGYRVNRKTVFRKGLKKVKVTETIDDLSDFAMKRGITLALLKQYNPWVLKNSLTIKEEGKKYILEIPSPLPKIIPQADSVIHKEADSSSTSK
ncbi:MAG: lytic transglycosylase domain-containing protein [Bacteroidota bacterium]